MQGQCKAYVGVNLKLPQILGGFPNFGSNLLVVYHSPDTGLVIAQGLLFSSSLGLLESVG